MVDSGLHLGALALRIAVRGEREPAELVARIEDHLKACWMCRNEVERLQTLSLPVSPPRIAPHLPDDAATSPAKSGWASALPVSGGHVPNIAVELMSVMRARRALEDVFYESQEEISLVFSELRQQEHRARRLCRDVCDQLGFELAALQLKDPRRGTIETVAAQGPAMKWIGAARHPMRPEAGWKDIQVEVATTGRGEVIRGRDERFDRDLFKRFGHRHALRAFVPVALLRDRRSLQYSAVAEWRAVETQNGNLAIEAVVPEEFDLEVCGTVEAGYLDGANKTIDLAALKRLATLISFACPTLYRSTMRAALEAATDVVRRYSGAASASLHVCVDELHRYTYNVVAGLAGAMATAAETGGGGITDPPRTEGLGQRALALRKPVWMPNPLVGDKVDELKRFNPNIWSKHGVRAMVALPLRLRTQGGELQGVLYVHYFRQKPIDDRVVQNAFRLVRRVVDETTAAIEQQETNENRRQTGALLDLVLSRLERGRSRLLPRDIVRIGRQIVGADVAGILRRDRRRWAARASVIGSRQGATVAQRFVHSIADAVLAEDAQGQGLFVPDVREAPWLCGALIGDKGRATFAECEGILSAAALALRNGKNRTPGFLFLGFRTARSFSEAECAVIRLLARLSEGYLRGRRPRLDRVDVALAQRYLAGVDPDATPKPVKTLHLFEGEPFALPAESPIDIVEEEQAAQRAINLNARRVHGNGLRRRESEPNRSN